MTKLFLRSWMRDAFLSGVSFMRNSFALIGPDPDGCCGISHDAR